MSNFIQTRLGQPTYCCASTSVESHHQHRGGGAGPHSPAQGGHEAKEREAKALREIAIGTIAIMPNDTETSRGLLRQHESVCSEARVHIPYVIEATQEVARADPYERADITSNTYYDWLIDHVFLLVPAQDYVGQFLATFRDYQPRQKAPSFNMDEVLAKLKEAK